MKVILLFILFVTVSAQAAQKAPEAKRKSSAKASLVQPALKNESKKIKRATVKFPPRPASGTSAQ